MEFNINVGRFVEELGPVIDVATKNTVKDFDGANNIILESNEKGIFAIAHGGLCAISVNISNEYVTEGLKYESIVPGRVTVNAKKLVESSGGSFPPSEVIKIKSVKGEDEGSGSIRIIPTSDPEQFQGFPLERDEIEFPTLAKKYETDINVNREIFIEGLQKVKFAIGYEDNRPQYLCSVFDAYPEGIKFTTGTGARFAIDEIQGKGITNATSKKRMIFPRNNITNIISVLKLLKDLQIDIKEAFASNDNSDHILISTPTIKMVILGVDPNLRGKYVDVESIIQFDHPYQIETDLAEWQWPTQGVRITYSEEMRRDNDIHNVEIIPDFKNSFFKVITESPMPAMRKIKISKICKKGKEEDILLRCNSMYLFEIVKEGGETKGVMTIRFIDQGSPIVVDFPDKINEDRKTVEKYSMFFTTSKK